MTETLVNFRTAWLAKEKGFNWEVYNYFEADADCEEPRWETKYNRKCENHNAEDNELIKRISFPTQSHLQKWLRHVHNINIAFVLPAKNYEEALEDFLVEGLHLVTVK